MPRSTCETPGCPTRVQRTGARCPECRRYLRSAAERKRLGKPPEITPLNPETVEEILVHVEAAERLLAARRDPKAVQQQLRRALQVAEPWRTLREEIIGE